MNRSRKWIAFFLALLLTVTVGILPVTAEDLSEVAPSEKVLTEETPVSEETSRESDADTTNKTTETTQEKETKTPETKAAPVTEAAARAKEAQDEKNEDSKQEKVTYYKHYVSIGDSCGSGVGLPAYLELAKKKGTQWIAAQQIAGSYPMRVAEAVGAETLGQYHFPGARTADIRYLLDGKFTADWILTGQAAILSNGVVSKQTMDSYRDEVTAAIQKADLISIDVGINDVWLPLIAALYDISGEGQLLGRNLTVPELVMRYGSVGALIANVTHFVNAWILHPTEWPSYVLKLISALAKWAIDYQINFGAIINRIHELNPKATVVVCGLYNPVNNWDFLPFINDNLIERVLQPYYSLLNLRKLVATTFYWGDARYVRMDDIELISDSFTIPLFEFTTHEDARGYNPHPTLEGAAQQARNILRTLRVPY